LKKMIITLFFFDKNANFFAENWEKSQKIVIITSIPDKSKCKMTLWAQPHKTNPQLGRKPHCLLWKWLTWNLGLRFLGIRKIFCEKIIYVYVTQVQKIIQRIKVTWRCQGGITCLKSLEVSRFINSSLKTKKLRKIVYAHT
jgi:hypothetical protein